MASEAEAPERGVFMPGHVGCLLMGFCCLCFAVFCLFLRQRCPLMECFSHSLSQVASVLLAGKVRDHHLFFLISAVGRNCCLWPGTVWAEARKWWGALTANKECALTTCDVTISFTCNLVQPLLAKQGRHSWLSVWVGWPLEAQSEQSQSPWEFVYV